MEKKYQIPDWLVKLQENSWELELLISGGAIFSLFQASDYIMSLSDSMRMLMGLAGHGMILTIVLFGIKLLTLGFVFHLLLRAFWVSMVFVNFVYPKGVKESRITFRKPYKYNMGDRKDLYNPIMKVDRLSGMVMFLSIISTVAIAGFMLVMVVLIAIGPGGLVMPPAVAQNVVPVLVWFFVLYVFDLLLFGLLRRIPVLNYILFPVFWLYDIMSLRFIYRKPLMVFATNISRWKASIVIFFFLVLALIMAYLTIQQSFHWPNVFDRRESRSQLADNAYVASFYKDQGSTARIRIPSKIIKGNILELEIEYWASDNNYFEYMKKFKSRVLMSEMIQISIDDSVYKSINWYPFKYKDNRCGITAGIPIPNLELGDHVLKIEFIPELQEFLKKERIMETSFYIPFWVDRK